MSDDSLVELEDNGAVSSGVPKRGRAGGFIPSLLKYIAIGVGAVILIVVVVIITLRIVPTGSAGGSNTNVTLVSDEYKSQKEILDWYTSLGAIRTKTSDEISASVVADVYLGYKKDDKATSTEITQRNVELKDFLRRYFRQKTIAELKPQNEAKLKIELRNAINDEILSNSKIRDVSIQQLDVIEQ